MHAIQLDPSNAQFYYNCGNVYGHIGDHHHAIENLTIAMRLAPEFAQAHFNRGVVYAQMGEREKAIADMRKAIAIDPTYVRPRQALQSLGVQGD